MTMPPNNSDSIFASYRNPYYVDMMVSTLQAFSNRR